MKCPLCLAESITEYAVIAGILYLECKDCSLVFKHPTSHPTKESEKARYLLHQNNIQDQNYRKFVSPIVQQIKKDQNPSEQGLDFGAGPGPVISSMLKEGGYSLNLYDPYFHPDTTVLNRIYDFIVCCEVMEHFKHPNEEFALLKKLLKLKGSLYCKTQLLPKKENFKTWYYKNDSTHLCFYSEKNLRWIETAFSFSALEISENLIVFKN